MISWWTTTSKFHIAADTEVAATQIEYAVPDQIYYLSLLQSLDNGEFYAYLYQAVCEFTQEFKITKYFANLKKPYDYPVSVPLTYPPLSMLSEELKS